MSEKELPAPAAPGADGQSPPQSSLITNTSECSKKRRSADATIKDQEAVRAYLSFKQTKGLMTDSEKRLLDKIAAVCGLSIGGLELPATKKN